MRHKTLHNTILNTYFIIIFIAFTFMAILYAAIQIPNQKEQIFNTLYQHTISASTSVDNEVEQMRTIALNITYSSMVQERFFQEDSTSQDMSSTAWGAQDYSTLLTALIFPNRPVDQINLYSLDHMMIASGLHNVVSSESYQDLEWYETVTNTPNQQIIYYSGYDEKISKYFTEAYGKEFISLVMVNYNNFNDVCGYIELKQRLNRVISSILNYNSSYGEQMYFFDKQGTLIYPLDAEVSPDLFTYAREHASAEEFLLYKSDGFREYIYCIPSDNGNFYTVMALGENELLKPVRDHVFNIILMTILAFISTFTISHFVSRRITTPIEEICEQVSHIDIEHPKPLQPLETDITELETLHSTFVQMQSTLSEHVDKLLLLQNQEMQSRMLALQAQMNPHFLFNGLASIQAMADEGMNQEIASMCQSMANILRYISSASEQEVPLLEEIHYTKDFLNCMYIRYQGDLTYQIDEIPDAMNEIMVPKLCVQLLVENAIKFTTSKRPPYHIHITGVFDDDHYELHIKDNGPGFEQETLDMLYQKMEEIKKTSMLPSLKINGMGILNVFIRYHLLHENHFIFRLENNPEGGACVVIGEYYDESEV